MKKLVRTLVLAASLASLGAGAKAQQGVGLATGYTDFTSWSLYEIGRAHV
jgi:hypothetical protein